MRRYAVLVLASAAFWSVPVCGQQAFAPPAVLRVVREDIKAGKGAAHEKSEAAFMQAAAKVKYRTHILGITAVTGTSHALFLQGLNDFASIVESQAALDTPDFAALDAIDTGLMIGRSSLVASYRPDLSYAADKINLPKTRFISIQTVQIRAGQGQKFAELARMMVRGAEKSGDNQPVATYQVVSGAPNGTYLVLQPMASLKSMDEGAQRQRALLGAAGVAQSDLDRQVSEAVASEESILYAVNPQMSYVPPEWIQADPTFWTPKPVEPPKPPVKTSSKTAKRPVSK